MPFSESDPNFNPDNLSEADRRTLDASKKEVMDPTMAGIVKSGDVRGAYKIEIHFGPGRTDRAEYKALVLLMESGKFYHGGGDGQMYACLDHRAFEKHEKSSALPALRAKFRKQQFPAVAGCGFPIPSEQIHMGRAMCPHCQHIIDATFLTSGLPFYGTTQDLAEMTEILFLQLHSDADIYCKYDRMDIRYDACLQKAGPEKARQLRGLHIYPLKNILRDITAGSDLRSRFTAFFRS